MVALEKLLETLSVLKWAQEMALVILLGFRMAQPLETALALG